MGMKMIRLRKATLKDKGFVVEVDYCLDRVEHIELERGKDYKSNIGRGKFFDPGR